MNKKHVNKRYIMLMLLASALICIIIFVPGCDDISIKDLLPGIGSGTDNEPGEFEAFTTEYANLLRMIDELYIGDFDAQEIHTEAMRALVFALDDGRPIENKVLYSRFSKLISTNNLPPVVFHSIRHTSTTYKLKTTQGDVKSVQGDTGHANGQMVLDVYAEIVDQDRMTHAQTFEKDFFGNGSLLNAFGETGEVLRIETPEVLHNQDVVKVLHLMQNDPQLMNRLLSMAQAG